MSGAGVEIEPLTEEQKSPCPKPQISERDHPKITTLKLAEAFAVCSDKKDDVTEHAEAIEKKIGRDAKEATTRQ